MNINNNKNGLTLIETLITLGLLGIVIPFVFMFSGDIYRMYMRDISLAKKYLEAHSILWKLSIAFKKNESVFLRDGGLFWIHSGQEIAISDPTTKVTLYSTTSFSSITQRRMAISFSIGSTSYEDFFEQPYE